MSETRIPMSELKVDADSLYREETITDLKVATIRRLVPVRRDGSPDPSRETLFVANTTLMSAGGPLPVSCPIEAATLEEALNRFPEAIQQGVQALIEEAREMQRQEASRIVVPGGPLPGLRDPFSTGGGGKIIP